MACPTCGKTMHNLGLESERTFWCPSCGSIKTETGGFTNASVPRLVDRVREADSRVLRVVPEPGPVVYNAIPKWDWFAICEVVGCKVVGG